MGCRINERSKAPKTCEYSTNQKGVHSKALGCLFQLTYMVMWWPSYHRAYANAVVRKWWASLCRKMVSSEQVIDAYMQESGRYWRDGELSYALPYYSNKQLSRKKMDGSHVISEEMRIYCTNKSVCWWTLLMSAFEDNPYFDQPKPIPDAVMYGLIHACAPSVLKLT